MGISSSTKIKEDFLYLNYLLLYLFNLLLFIYLLSFTTLNIDTSKFLLHMGEKF